MVLKLGINEWPMPGRVVRRSTYVKEYDELTHKDGMPFVPGRGVEGHDLLRLHHLQRDGVRGILRAVWSERIA